MTNCILSVSACIVRQEQMLKACKEKQERCRTVSQKQALEAQIGTFEATIYHLRKLLTRTGIK